MGAKTDQVKGQVKEGAGSLTGDKDLESEGKADRRAGEAKEKLDHAKVEVEEVIDQAEDKVEDGNVDVGSHDSTTGDTPVTGGFLSEQPERRTFESVFARLVATAGIVGVGTALGAILIAVDVAGWITGLVVSIVTVALAAMLWRSRRL
jgi:uncharacterized protein YjbJ (UPF0337 family)